jgi:hypothetical protein
VWFDLDDHDVEFPLYEMTTPTVALYDELSDTVMGISLMEWDSSSNKYHSKFMLLDDVKGTGENYKLKLMFIPTSVEEQVNSTASYSVDLIPVELSEICIYNDREIVVQEDYSFALDTKFELEYGQPLDLKGYILDDSSYWRHREIIDYKATDPIGHSTLTLYDLDVHGLIGDSDMVDVNNFVLEYIDRDNYNTITKLYEIEDGQEQYKSDKIDECEIEYYGYYQTAHPNKFVLRITWDNESLIPFDTQLLISYHVDQGKQIFPETF